MISAWKKAVRSIQNQIHYSHSHDPYLNLAVEHYLLTNSPKDSNVLFLYRNSPSIVIGRNQNPWLEVNHVALRSKSRINGNDGAINPQPSLVRRRSGGGTVYHDLNNLNYCAICPPADFKRDKHAEMLVRAIRPFNARARVNQRHDVVLDQGQSQGLSSSDVEKSIDEQDTHSTPYQSSLPPLKISGSAFKIIRDRALHHGTCILQLLNSSNFRDLLDSPARGFIDAFGVESVRSPVGAVFGSGAPDDHSAKFTRQTHLELVRNIMAEFCQMYSIDKTNLRAFDRDESLLSDEKLVWSDPKETFAACYVKEAHEDVEEIREGVNDLKVPTHNPSLHTPSHPIHKSAYDMVFSLRNGSGSKHLDSHYRVTQISQPPPPFYQINPIDPLA